MTSCISETNDEGGCVECFILFLLLVFIAIVVSGIGLRPGIRGQARAYEQLTRRFGGVFQRGGFLRRCSTRFRYGQTWVIVTPGSGGGAGQRSTQAILQWLDGRTDFRLETRGDAGAGDSAEAAAAQATRDRQFQATYQVTGPNADDSRRLLSDGVRWQVNQLAQLPQLSALRISIRHGRLFIEKALPIRRFEDLEQFTQLCLEFYDQAMLTRSEGIEFLGAPDEALPLDDPVCQVCGEPIVSNMVYCRRCFTPHHLECWQYNGLCSTYGCRETRYSIPTVARRYHQPDDNNSSPTA
jgi:hypothetical protein